MNPPPSPRRKRFPLVWYLLALFLILAFAFAPVGSVILCAWIANAYGCKVDEGSVHPCIIGGHDYVALTYDLGALAWYALGPLPEGGLGFLLCPLDVLLLVATCRQRPA